MVAVFGSDGEITFVKLKKPTLPYLEKRQNFL